MNTLLGIVLFYCNNNIDVNGLYLNSYMWNIWSTKKYPRADIHLFGEMENNLFKLPFAFMILLFIHYNLHRYGSFTDILFADSKQNGSYILLYIYSYSIVKYLLIYCQVFFITCINFYV